MESTLILYLLKANIALAILYIIYKVLFRNDTFFMLRRITILTIIFIAFTFQLPDLSHWISETSDIQGIVTSYSLWMPQGPFIINTQQAASSSARILLPNILSGIYLVGVSLLFIRCLIEIHILTNTWSKNKKYKNICLLKEENEAYSFFGWIFMSENKIKTSNADKILIHETAHVRQLHSIDIMIGEIMCILCWFNPFSWMLKREMAINHEYLADAEVMNEGCDKKTYQYLLLGMEHPINPAIANLNNHFSVLLLKKRITMLNKRKTNQSRKAKYLTLIPMAVAFLIINNIDAMARIVGSPTTEVSIPSKVSSATKPEYPGGDDAFMKFVASSIKYPIKALESGVTGTVVCDVTIGTDGKIQSIKPGILQSKDNELVVVGYAQGVTPVDTPNAPILFEEASRVLNKAATWIPAKDDKGNAIVSIMSIPVTFRLQ